MNNNLIYNVNLKTVRLDKTLCVLLLINDRSAFVTVDDTGTFCKRNDLTQDLITNAYLNDRIDFGDLGKDSKGYRILYEIKNNKVLLDFEFFSVINSDFNIIGNDTVNLRDLVRGDVELLYLSYKDAVKNNKDKDLFFPGTVMIIFKRLVEYRSTYDLDFGEDFPRELHQLYLLYSNQKDKVDKRIINRFLWYDIRNQYTSLSSLKFNGNYIDYDKYIGENQIKELTDGIEYRGMFMGLVEDEAKKLFKEGKGFRDIRSQLYNKFIEKLKKEGEFFNNRINYYFETYIENMKDVTNKYDDFKEEFFSPRYMPTPGDDYGIENNFFV